MSDQTAHRALREALGSYVLGHLPDDEAARLRVHLDDCASCRADLAELEPAARALASARPVADPVATPSPDLAARIDSRIRSVSRDERRQRHLRDGVVAMLSAAAAVAVLLVGLRVTAPEVAQTVPLEAVAVVEQADGVRATADLVDHTWGVEVKLKASGLRNGDQYSVTVMSADGTNFPAGAFVGTGAKAVKCNLNAGVLRADAVGFVVRDIKGVVILRSSFSDPAV